MNKRSFDIAALVDDLAPAQPINAPKMLGIAAAVTLVGVILIITGAGMREDLLAGKPGEIFLLRSGVLGLLGFATAHSVLAMASPSVGKQNSSWQMALAGAALFPLAGIIAAMTGDNIMATAPMRYGFECLAYSLVAGSATAIPMVITLRRGAPTSPERAGWLTGVAAGGLGAFAYNFHCAFNSLTYIGVWYTAAVGICAILGRIIVPRLIRW